ncbi:sugar transferase [Marisediminicola sp. LYQ134]|uniref:sugar transferase n=1 Tax=Marisediminicola sp. LYQ134 TaxID=3391061 RepID=UPI003982E1FF
MLAWVVIGVQIAWFGLDSAQLAISGDTWFLVVNYTAISIAIIGAWMMVLSFFGTRGYKVLGTGPEEYKLIIDASIRLFGLIAIIAYLFQAQIARGYVLIAFPLGVAVLVLSRWIWRQWLCMERRLGRRVSKVMLVGSLTSAAHIARELARAPEAGYQVVGACVGTGEIGGTLLDTGVPIMGRLDQVLASLDASGADTVIVTSSEQLPPDKMRELSWSLEPGRRHLIVAPSLTDIGGPRIHTRPVAGLPLIHVETPRFEGRKSRTKRSFDIIVSAMIITLISPLLAIIAIGVRLSDSGPVLFRQQRIGIGGRPFVMLKFRSMRPDAEALLGELLESGASEGNSVMFKMKNDPRVTPLGRFMRRFSLDELPQLFNVFGGSMSLVGPRPPLESEVSAYETHVHRRFLVKPGITGLWQVSGRSRLSWEDTVRLDLYYVENWSTTGDLVILWRTVKAVLGRDGAY